MLVTKIRDNNRNVSVLKIQLYSGLFSFSFLFYMSLPLQIVVYSNFYLQYLIFTSLHTLPLQKELIFDLLIEGMKYTLKLKKNTFVLTIYCITIPAGLFGFFVLRRVTSYIVLHRRLCCIVGSVTSYVVF